ncbi:MAG: hypothetical protein WDN28_08830 [Chthoniobacter sp.]
MSQTHPPSPTDPFRINMQLSFGPNQPANPPPVPPATCWWDVSNWQTFLRQHNFLPANYPNNMFDQTTSMATKNFQASPLGGAPVNPSGFVDLNTYNKAVAVGMPAYPKVIS